MASERERDTRGRARGSGSRVCHKSNQEAERNKGKRRHARGRAIGCTNTNHHNKYFRGQITTGTNLGVFGDYPIDTGLLKEWYEP